MPETEDNHQKRKWPWAGRVPHSPTESQPHTSEQQQDFFGNENSSFEWSDTIRWGASGIYDGVKTTFRGISWGATSVWQWAFSSEPVTPERLRKLKQERISQQLEEDRKVRNQLIDKQHILDENFLKEKQTTCQNWKTEKSIVLEQKRKETINKFFEAGTDYISKPEWTVQPIERERLNAELCARLECGGTATTTPEVQTENLVSKRENMVSYSDTIKLEDRVNCMTLETKNNHECEGQLIDLVKMNTKAAIDLEICQKQNLPAIVNRNEPPSAVEQRQVNNLSPAPAAGFWWRVAHLAAKPGDTVVFVMVRIIQWVLIVLGVFAAYFFLCKVFNDIQTILKYNKEVLSDEKIQNWKEKRKNKRDEYSRKRLKASNNAEKNKEAKTLVVFEEERWASEPPPPDPEKDPEAYGNWLEDQTIQNDIKIAEVQKTRKAAFYRVAFGWAMPVLRPTAKFIKKTVERLSLGRIEIRGGGILPQVRPHFTKANPERAGWLKNPKIKKCRPSEKEVQAPPLVLVMCIAIFFFGNPSLSVGSPQLAQPAFMSRSMRASVPIIAEDTIDAIAYVVEQEEALILENKKIKPEEKSSRQRKKQKRRNTQIHTLASKGFLPTTGDDDNEEEEIVNQIRKSAPQIRIQN